LLLTKELSRIVTHRPVGDTKKKALAAASCYLKIFSCSPQGLVFKGLEDYEQ
jgi:hypothetical protein